MEKITELNSQDIMQVIADHFNIDVEKVWLKIKARSVGYGCSERDVYDVIAIVKE